MKLERQLCASHLSYDEAFEFYPDRIREPLKGLKEEMMDGQILDHRKIIWWQKD